MDEKATGSAFPIAVLPQLKYKVAHSPKSDLNYGGTTLRTESSQVRTQSTNNAEVEHYRRHLTSRECLEAQCSLFLGMHNRALTTLSLLNVRSNVTKTFQIETESFLLTWTELRCSGEVYRDHWPHLL